MRWAAAAMIAMLGGCAEQPAQTLWPGPDWRKPSAPTAAPGAAATSDASDVTTERDETATRVPRVRTRRGSGTPPDILFPQNEQRPPQPAEPTTAPPVPQRSDPSTAILAPRDPKSPYSADGFGYQRQGPTILGPNGTSTMVGSSIFGPRGQTCHAVGSSLFCN